MSVIRYESEVLSNECTSCGEVHGLGSGVIQYHDYRSTAHQVISLCPKCSTRIIGSLIQDYADVVSKNILEVWAEKNVDRAARIAAACEMVAKVSKAWIAVEETLLLMGEENENRHAENVE